MAQPVPADVAHLVPSALAAAEAAMAPIGPQGVGVLLDDFCALVPVPMMRDPENPFKQVVDAAFTRALIARLKDKPESVVRAALDHVVDTHKWETPVKVAQVVEAVEAELPKRCDELRRLRSAALRLRMDGCGRKSKTDGEAPRLYRDKSPQEREKFDAILARYRSGGDGVPLFEDERMTDSEKERRRAASLRRHQEPEHV